MYHVINEKLYQLLNIVHFVTLYLTAYNKDGSFFKTFNQISLTTKTNFQRQEIKSNSRVTLDVKGDPAMCLSANLTVIW